MILNKILTCVIILKFLPTSQCVYSEKCSFNPNTNWISTWYCRRSIRVPWGKTCAPLDLLDTISNVNMWNPISFFADLTKIEVWSKLSLTFRFFENYFIFKLMRIRLRDKIDFRFYNRPNIASSRRPFFQIFANTLQL